MYRKLTFREVASGTRVRHCSKLPVDFTAMAPAEALAMDRKFKAAQLARQTAQPPHPRPSRHRPADWAAAAAGGTAAGAGGTGGGAWKHNVTLILSAQVVNRHR